MKIYDKKCPDSTKDILFDICAIRTVLKNRLLYLYKSRGFNEVKTPVLEYYDVFASTKSNFVEENMYKLCDTKGRLLVLRPDCTIPMARVVATRLKDEAKPNRLCYSQNVYRVNDLHCAKNNEISQVGIEVIGTQGYKSDLELLSLATQSIKICTDKKFRLELCHIDYLTSLIDELDAPKNIKQKILIYIERKNYTALNDILSNYKNCNSYVALTQIPKLFGNKDVIIKAKEIFSSKKSDNALDYLANLYEKLSELGYKDNITIDLGIVNKSNYYTGIMFKGYAQGVGEEILAGGRYDNLTKVYGDDLPAVGFAINIENMQKICNIKKEAKRKILVYAKYGYETKAIQLIDTLKSDYDICEYSTFDNIEKSLIYAKNKDFKTIAIVDDTVIFKEV